MLRNFYQFFLKVRLHNVYDYLIQLLIYISNAMLVCFLQKVRFNLKYFAKRLLRHLMLPGALLG